MEDQVQQSSTMLLSRATNGTVDPKVLNAVHTCPLGWDLTPVCNGFLWAMLMQLRAGAI